MSEPALPCRGVAETLPRYRPTRPVWALKIVAVEPASNGGARLFFDGWDCVLATPGMVAHFCPREGDYLVLAHDGSQTIRPGRRFEECYERER